MSYPTDPALRRELANKARHLRLRADQFRDLGALRGSEVWKREAEAQIEVLERAADALDGNDPYFETEVG